MFSIINLRGQLPPQKIRFINSFYLKMSIVQVNGFIQIGVSESYNLICSSAEKKTIKNIYHIYSNLTTKETITIRLEWFRSSFQVFKHNWQWLFCGTPLQNTSHSSHQHHFGRLYSLSTVRMQFLWCWWPLLFVPQSWKWNMAQCNISVLDGIFSTSVIMEQRVVLRC